MVSGFNHIDFGNNFDFGTSVGQPIDVENAKKLDDAANNNKIIYLTATTVQGYNISTIMSMFSSSLFCVSVHEFPSSQTIHFGFEKVDGIWYFRLNVTK